MAWSHYEQNYVYNYDINYVLDAVMRAASQNKLKLKSADRANYRVQFTFSPYVNKDIPVLNCTL